MWKKKFKTALAACLCPPSPNPLQLHSSLPQRVLRRHTSFKFTHMQMLRCDLHFKVFNSPYLLGSEALLIIDLCASGNHISIFCVVFNDSNNSNMQKVVLWTISLIISSKHHSFSLLFFFSERRLSLNKKKGLKNHKLDCAMRHWWVKTPVGYLMHSETSLHVLPISKDTNTLRLLCFTGTQVTLYPKPFINADIFHHKSSLRLWNSSLYTQQKQKKNTCINK